MNAELFCFYCLGALALTADYHSEFTAGAVYLGAALMWLGLCVLNAHLKRLIELQMAYQDEEDGGPFKKIGVEDERTRTI